MWASGALRADWDVGAISDQQLIDEDGSEVLRVVGCGNGGVGWDVPHDSASTTFVNVSFASPNVSTVFGAKNSSFSMPAKPGRIDRFSTMQDLARSAFRTGMP